MNTDELREHLREMAATRSIDASIDRNAVDSRARRYRRNRRRIASIFVGLAIAGVLVVLIVADGGSGSRSVRVPPAHSTVAPQLVPRSDSVAECVRRWQTYQREFDPEGDPTSVSFFDHGTGGAATLTIEDYCQQVHALEEADPSSSSDRTGFEISNGRVIRGPTAPSSTLRSGSAP
jgi:hypothetical protein